MLAQINLSLDFIEYLKEYKTTIYWQSSINSDLIIVDFTIAQVMRCVIIRQGSTLIECFIVGCISNNDVNCYH